MNDTVKWTYEVKNIGNVVLKNVTVTDDRLPSFKETIASLALQATHTFTAPESKALAGQYVNNGTVTGTPPTGPNISSTNISHYFGQTPSISIIKRTNGIIAPNAPGPYIPVGGPVTWTYQVNNTGNVVLTDVLVTDDKLGVIGTISTLAVGATQTFTAPPGTASVGQYSNLGNATGKPPVGSNVSDEDPSHYFGSLPAINLSKEADRTNAKVGEEIVYNFTIKNVGTNDIEITDLKDTYLSSFAPNPIGTILTPKGTPGDTLIVTGKYTVIDTDLPGPIVNIAIVDGKDSQGNKVNSTDTATVSLGALVVTKTADPTFGSPSTNVTFTLLVKNSGSTPLPHVYVNDQLPLGMSYRSSSSGGRNLGQIVYWSDIGPMIAGATKSLEIIAHIDGPVSGIQTLTNHVDVEGKPEHGNNVTNNTTTTVEAREPKITVTKTADPTFGSKGTLVTFTMNVNNTASAPLPHVFVHDLLPAGLTYHSSSSGSTHSGQNVDWSDIGPMAPGSMKSLWIKATIDGTVYGILTNQVDVAGKPEYGGNVTDSATATVAAGKAAITVTKIAKPTVGSIGALVNFTLDVTNSGDSLLSHIFVNDLLPDVLVYDSSSSGGVNVGQTVYWSDVGPLAAGSSKSMWIKATIDGSKFGLLTNVVDVEGQPQFGENVTSRATAIVTALESGILVEKTALPDHGAAGTIVRFGLAITNTDRIDLKNVFVTDKLPEGMSYVASDGGINNGLFINWSDIGPLSSGAPAKMLWIDARIDGPITESENLTNRVDVDGRPEFGKNVTGFDTADVEAQAAGIIVDKVANPSEGTKGVIITFPMKITNQETMKMVKVKGVDTLPLGLKYIPDGTTPEPSSNVTLPDGRMQITWEDLGPLNSQESHDLTLKASVTGSVMGQLTNEINATGVPEFGADVYASDTADVLVQSASINVTKTATPPEGIPGEKITFTIVINNTGSATLCQVYAEDIIPDGLQYLSDDHNGTLAAPNKVVWNDLGCLEPGESIRILLETDIVGTIMGDLNNVVAVSAMPLGGGDLVGDRSQAIAKANPVPYIISKTSDKSSYRPGEEMTYTITVCNVMKYQTLEEVVVKDVFQNQAVRIVASYPEASDDGQWYFSSIPPLGCVKITLVAVYPESNMTFDMAESAVSGKGFVNVHNDLSTGTPPFPVTNCVYVTAKIYYTDRSDYTSWSQQKCYSVTIKDSGTELLTREHGSGVYQTEEKTKLFMKNRSIESLKNVSASYYPTTFELPGNNGLNYVSKWTEESRAKNHITGAVMHETYRYATYVDRDSYIKMDENGSKMMVDASFTGKGSIGFFKKASPEDGPKKKPIFESQEDYSGQFSINESFDEYGKNVITKKAASGEGFVAADKRVRDSQRTYESGTGSYKSEEIVDSFSNYMAKDIEVAHKPSSYNYSPYVLANQDMKWNEGMWSKSGGLRGGSIVAANSSTGGAIGNTCVAPNSGTSPATIISEKFSSLQYLKKDSIALGLNEMKTNATFNGVADFRAKSVSTNATNEVDNEERYVGEFGLTRHILMTGVSKYDYPHVIVTKEGQMKSEWVNRVNSTVADYIITVTNDGNRALAPIYVTDIFPPGTQYVSSSFKPSSLTATGANWTILHLGIGNSLTILLKLNITEHAPDNVLNCVVASGVTDGTLVSSTNCSSLDSAWLGCCAPDVSLEKKAQLDSRDPTVVHYTILLRNNANSSVAAKVTDEIPGDMGLLNSSVEPYSIDSNYIHWNYANLRPGEMLTIEYSMHAARNGAYTNRVHVDTSALDGSGSGSADASAYIDVRETGVAPRTTRYDGWQPPDWDLNTSEEGISM